MTVVLDGRISTGSMLLEPNGNGKSPMAPTPFASSEGSSAAENRSREGQAPRWSDKS